MDITLSVSINGMSERRGKQSHATTTLSDITAGYNMSEHFGEESIYAEVIYDEEKPPSWPF